MLSARQVSDDKVEALDAGADDYMTKPFRMDELSPACAALRREWRRQRSRLSFPLASCRWTWLAKVPRPECVRLTPLPVELLEVLVQARGKLVGRGGCSEVWGPAYNSETNYLRVYAPQLERDPSTPAHHHRAGHGLPVRD